jgi:hypothetical protein
MTALDERIRRLTDEQLLVLQRSFRSPPKTADPVRVIDRELESRHQRQRDQAKLPSVLEAIASRMRGDENIDEISEAQRVALVVFKPDSYGARRIAERARGLPEPRPHIERRRFVPPQPSPPMRSPALGAPDPAQPSPNAPAATPAAPSNVVFLPRATRPVSNISCRSRTP